MADTGAQAVVAPRPLTHRRVLAVALPIVLSNATVPLLGLVDTGVIGQLGRAAPIGAVGIGAVILVSIYWIFGFLRMGTSGLVAQSHGRGDRAEVGAHLLRALAIAGAAGIGIILLQVPLFALAARLAPASVEVEELARQYLAIRVWGAPATIALYALSGWLIAVERTRGILALQLLQNGLNVALDLWFVLGLGYGVGGIAVATLIAEYAGLALGLWFARRVLADAIRAARGTASLFAKDKINRLLRVNGDIMIRSVALQASITAFVFMGAAHGDITLAANQVLTQFLHITAYALDGFAFAAEALVGQAVGAGRPDRVRRATILSGQWSLAGAAILALIFLVAGPWIIDLLTTAPQVRIDARTYLPWLVAAPLIGVTSWLMDGVFIGATLTREMRNAMLLSVAVYLVALMTLPLWWGNHGLWAALMVLNACRGVAMSWLYPRAETAAGQS